MPLSQPSVTGLARMALRAPRPAFAMMLALGLVGCGTADRLGSIGKSPSLSAIENPNSATDYQPVKLPMPGEELQVREANSLWRSGSRASSRTSAPPGWVTFSLSPST